MAAVIAHRLRPRNGRNNPLEPFRQRRPRQFADVHVALWNAIEAKDEALARHIFRHLLPLLDFEASYGIPLCKEVLRLRGVIPSAAWRQTGYRALDSHALREAATILDGLGDFLLPAYRHDAAGRRSA